MNEDGVVKTITVSFTLPVDHFAAKYAAL